MSDLFVHFARVAEAVSATSARNAKADAVAAYLGTLDDADLMRAARFASGRVFSLSDQRSVNVGTAVLLRAVGQATGQEPDALRPRLVALGDEGDVAAEAALPLCRPPSALTLEAAETFFAHLAALRGLHARTDAVAQRLAPLSPVEARYLVRLLAGNLRVGLLESGVESALCRLYGVPLAAVQRATLLTGDIGETALLARRGTLESAQMRLFHPLRFMLATAAEGPDDVARQMPPRMAVEDKFDGIRAQAHVGPDPGAETLHGVAHAGVRVALFSRTLDTLTPAFPDLVEPLAQLLAAAPAGLILDGEIVPVAGESIRPFQDLQKRLGRKKVAAAVLESVPVAFVVYDTLFFDGQVVLDRPYERRQALLDGLPFSAQVRRSAVAWMEGAAGLDEAFSAARARGNEGLMVKNPLSPYKPGRRGRDWLKVKKAMATLDVVVTAVERGSGKRNKLLSDFTFAVRAAEDDDTLLNVGKAYSGLTDAELERLTRHFEANTLQQFAHGRVRTVAPDVVVEVTFDRVQPSARHKGGFALRFPRIVRLRPDKPPSEIDTLETVRRLAEAS